MRFPFYDPTIARARAWVTACAGDLRSAAEQGLAAADLARRYGQLGVEVEALHDVARMGAAGQVCQRIQDTAERCDGTLADTYASHALQLVDRSPTGLESVAETFRRLGAKVLAAEAFAEAGFGFQEMGLVGRSRRCGSAADMLLENEQIGTPAFRLPLKHERLTPREIEIAVLARDGLSDAVIAERLGLSVRTVGNHLHNTYMKLGVSNRSELREAFPRYV